MDEIWHKVPQEKVETLRPNVMQILSLLLQISLDVNAGCHTL